MVLILLSVKAHLPSFLLQQHVILATTAEYDGSCKLEIHGLFAVSIISCVLHFLMLYALKR